jgi:hypothetical protein
MHWKYRVLSQFELCPVKFKWPWRSLPQVSYTTYVETALNRMDEDGWEFVGISQGYYFIFRRLVKKRDVSDHPETGIIKSGCDRQEVTAEILPRTATAGERPDSELDEIAAEVYRGQDGREFETTHD